MKQFTSGNALFRAKQPRHWPNGVERGLSELLAGRSLHIACGPSAIGDVRIDLDVGQTPDVCGDSANLPFGDRSFDTVLWAVPVCLPKDFTIKSLLEAARVSKTRLIVQHRCLPIDWKGRWPGWDEFFIHDIYLWQQQNTYFGEVYVISILERA